MEEAIALDDMVIPLDLPRSFQVCRYLPGLGRQCIAAAGRLTGLGLPHPAHCTPCGAADVQRKLHWPALLSKTRTFEGNRFHALADDQAGFMPTGSAPALKL